MGYFADRRQAFLSGTTDEDETQEESGGYFHQRRRAFLAGQDPVDAQPVEEGAGFVSSIKRDTGSAIQGLGTTLRDLGAEGVGSSLERTGAGIVRRNPATINTAEDALAHPGDTFVEAAGEGASNFGRTAGLALAGRVAGGVLGAPFGPAGVVAGQAIGSFALPAAANFVQEYGGIRQAQRQQGIDEPGRAAAAAAGAASIDTLTGLGGLGRTVGGHGLDILKREAGTKLRTHIAKQAGIGVITEAPTEAAQTVIERIGARQPLTGQEAFDDYAVSAIKGGLGGGVVRGGISTFAGQRRANAPQGELMDEPFPEELPAETGEPAPLLRDQVDQRLGIRPPMTAAERRAYIKEFEAAAAEESGQHIVQQQDNLERQLDQGQYFQLRAQEQAVQDLEEAKNDAAQHFGVTQNPNASLGWDVLGAKVFGQQALDGLLTELAAVKQQQPEHRQQLERALMEHNLVKLPASGKVPKAGQIARAFENKLKSLQLNEAQSTDEAVAILDAQINDLVAKGKNQGDIRLGELAMVYESLTGQVPQAVQQLEANVAPKEGEINVRRPVQPVTQPGTSGGSPRADIGAGVGNTGPNPASPVGAGGSTAARVVKRSGPAAAVVPAGNVQRPQPADVAPAVTAQPPVAAPAVAPAVAPQTPIAPVEPVVQRKRRRVVTPTGEPNVFVAPPTIEDQPDNRPSPEKSEPDEDAAISDAADPTRETGATNTAMENALEIASETGGDTETAFGDGGLVSAVRQEREGRRQDEAVLPDDAEERTLVERFKDSPNPQRDRALAKAYLTAMREAPHGTGGHIVAAIAKDFGVSEATVRAAGNTTPLVEAGRRLGFKPKQVRELFQVEDNVKRGRGKVATSEANVAADTAKALAKHGIVTGEGDTSGFGGLDSDRFWAKETTPAGKDNANIAALGERIEKLERLLQEFSKQGPPPLAETTARIQQLLDNTRADLAEFFKEAEARARAEAKKRSAKTTKALKRETKAKPVEEDVDERSAMTERERARKAWDRVAADLGPEFPRFKELPPDYQETFEEFGEQNWEDADVLQLLRQMERDGVKLRSEKNREDDGIEDRQELEFGRNAPPSGAYTAEGLRSELQAFMRADSLGDNVTVVDTPADLDDPADVIIGTANRNAFGWTKGGKVVLIASRIKFGEGRAKFMHEVGTHLGMERLLPAQMFDRLSNQVLQWSKGSGNRLEVQLAQRAVKRAEFAGDGPGTAKFKSELVAYFAEEATLAGVTPEATKQNSPAVAQWMRTVWQAFKNALKHLGLSELSAQDVVNLAHGAAKLEISGLAFGKQLDTAKFGRNAALPPAVQPQVNTVVGHLKDTANAQLNKVMFTHDLFKRAERLGLSAAKTMRELYERRAARVGALEREVTRVEDLYNRIPEHERGDGPVSANRFVYDATREAKWGFTPKWMTKATVDARMAQRFRKMSPESRAWIEAVFEHGHKTLELKKATAAKAIEDEYGPLIDQAKKDNDTARSKLLAARRAAHRKDFDRLFATFDGRPYAPLRRFGNYVVVAKSRAYQAAEAAGDTKKLAELETSADHYSVDFAENRAAAVGLRDQLKASGRFADVQARAKEDARSNMYGGLMSAFAKLRAEIDGQIGGTMDKEERDALRRAREAVNELYLTSLAETSARKSEMRRRGIAGEIDMLRSFATQGRADAHFIAAAENNTQMLDSINQMRRQVRTGDDQLEKSEAFVEIMKRYADSMHYEGDNWNTAVAAITRGVSVWMLATSPMYYLQNMTQPVMMSVPYMTGRHGWNESMGQLIRAYSQMAGIFKGSRATEQARFDNVPADVRTAINELVNRGRIDIGMETELGRVKLEDDTPVKRGLNRADDLLRVTAQKMEVINRVSTAMAAFRLELARTGDRQKAIDYADEVILSTHGDYTRFNAPRVFNTNAGRIALQFRKFQLIQLSLLAKLVHNSFGQNASAAERAAARKALGFTLGHMAVMAGAVGIPGFATVSFLTKTLDKLFGDDDEPPLDLEAELRKALGNGPLADMIIRGAPTLAGIDLSGRIGMGNALSIVPFVDIQADRKSYFELATSLTLGATGALGARAWDGVSLIMDGQYYRGLEKLLPRGLSEAAKAWREASEGVTRLNGDVLIRPEDISFAQSAAKMVGLPTVADTKRRFVQDQSFDTKEHFEGRADDIRREFMEARKEGRSTAAAVADWRRLQDARAKAGFTRQPISSLYRSAQNQKRREKQTVGGVQFGRENRKAVESLAN